VPHGTDEAEDRHSNFYDAWVNLGEDVVRVSRFLGHSKPSITLDLYADLFNEQDSVGMGDVLEAAYSVTERPA